MGRPDSDSASLGSNPSAPASQSVDIPHDFEPGQIGHIGTEGGSLTHKNRHSPRENLRRAQFVYVMRRNDGLCKIGISKNPEVRRSKLQISTPDRLTLFHVEKATGEPAELVERAVKLALQPWKKSGEWFTCEPELARLAVREMQINADEFRVFLRWHYAVDQLLEAHNYGNRSASELIRSSITRETAYQIRNQIGEMEDVLGLAMRQIREAYPEYYNEICPLL